MFLVYYLASAMVTIGLFLVVDLLTGRRGLNWLVLHIYSFRRPRVLVCTVNGVTGVVTRRDYERAMRKSRLGNASNVPSKPPRLLVDQTFLFKEGGAGVNEFNVTGDLFELEAFLAGCIVERGEFVIVIREFVIPSDLHRTDNLQSSHSFWYDYIYVHSLAPYRAGVSVSEDGKGRRVLSVARGEGKMFTLVVPPPTSVSTLH
ncbi:MAG: hypothetical protein V1696_03340 [Candidatus Jorgensenbacteria bacterium]